MTGRVIEAWVRSGVMALMIGAVPTGFASAQQCIRPGLGCVVDDVPCCQGTCQTAPNKPSGRCPVVGPPPLSAPMTKADQAMVSVGQMTYLFAVNQDNGHVLFTFWELGGGTQGWHEVGTNLCCGGTGDVVSNVAIGPTVTAVGNFLFLTITDSNGRIFLNQGTPPNPWVGWQAVH